MVGRRDYYKELRGKTRKDEFRRTSYKESLDQIWGRTHSAFPLRILGVGEQEVWVSEEQRTHTHIIGTTRVGKSRFLEHLIREDIDKGQGLCFIDSSEGGQTAYNILRYCAHIGHNKVVFIDPLHTYTFKKIAPINVFGDFPDVSQPRTEVQS